MVLMVLEDGMSTHRLAFLLYSIYQAKIECLVRVQR